MSYSFDSKNVFDEMGKYWAEIADKNQTEQQIQFLKNHIQGEGLVLDLACGTGRHTISLRSQGYTVIGLEVSRKLLGFAKQRSSGADLVRGDIRFLPFKADVFLAVMSMDTSLGYLPSEKEDAESFTETHRVLREGGAFIVDVFNRQNLVTKYQGKIPTPKCLEYPSFYLQQKRTVNNNGSWLCDIWVVRNKTNDQKREFEHKVRLYNAKRLQELLEEAGFEVNQVFGSYDGQEFSARTSRFILIATAK